MNGGGGGNVQLNDEDMRRLTGDKVFINIGSHAAMPSVPSLAEGLVRGARHRPS